MSLFAGKTDAITEAEKGEKERPGIREIKAIAEEGLIYGLPLVMYYTSAYELFVDKTSSQYKAPIGTLTNEARVFTYKDTAVITPNSDTPYSLMQVDLRAEPVVISVPAVPKPRYYSVQLTDANTFNYGYIGSRSTGTEAGDYLVVGPGWKSEPSPLIKQASIPPPRSRQLFSAPSSSMPAICPTWSKSRPVTKCSRSLRFSSRPPPPQPPAINYLKANAEIAKKEFWELLDFALQYSPAEPGGSRNPRPAGEHWHRSRQDLRP